MTNVSRDRKMRSGIFVPAYEAERTLEDLIRRIPPRVYDETTTILIQDDSSKDNTYAVARGLASKYPKIKVVRNDRNLGYGGTKKKAYRYFINNGYDTVTLLPGDLQYPPEVIPDIWRPLTTSEADIVLGSRFLAKSLRDNMPVYKWIGSNLLTLTANCVTRLQLTDYHTGFRSYTCAALRQVDIDTCSNGHEISMEILMRALQQKLRIYEVPVPTVYNDESRSCSAWTGIHYATAVLKLLWHYSRTTSR